MLPRVLREHDRTQVELRGSVTESGELEIVTGRRVAVHGDDIDTGTDVVLVQAADRERMGIEGDGGPRPMMHRHTHLLQLGADRAVQNDCLALLQARFELLVVGHLRSPEEYVSAVRTALNVG